MTPIVRAARPGDADAIAALCRAVQLELDGAPETTARDVAEFVERYESWVVFDGRELVGFAEAHPLGFEGYVRPDARDRGVGSLLLDLAERDGPRPCWASARDPAAGALLAARGYRPTRRYLRMIVEVDEPPEPRFPAAIRFGPLEPGEEQAVVAATNEAFGGHWGWSGVDVEWVVRLDPALVLVARDGDEAVGVARCVDGRFGGGWISALAVRPAWRGRGLGLALLHAAFAALLARGHRTIRLTVDSENTDALGLYRRVGMRVAHERLAFTRP